MAIHMHCRLDLLTSPAYKKKHFHYYICSQKNDLLIKSISYFKTSIYLWEKGETTENEYLERGTRKTERTGGGVMKTVDYWVISLVHEMWQVVLTVSLHLQFLQSYQNWKWASHWRAEIKTDMPVNIVTLKTQHTEVVLFKNICLI